MKRNLLLTLCAAALGGASVSLSAADNAAPPPPTGVQAPSKDAKAPAAPARPKPNAAQQELQDLVGKVSAELRKGKPTAESLAPFLKEFDALIEKHKGEKTADVAQIHMMKAMLYVQLLEDTEQGLPLLEKLAADFPDCPQAKQATGMVAGIKARANLKVGAAFPDFDVKDLEGKTVSLANYKGKTLLVDFWATWCGPCVGELPHVLKSYGEYHAKGFEILSVSLDRDEAKLSSFIKEKGMTWTHHFDEGGKLASAYGVESIPTTYLLDGQGKIVAKNLRGEQLALELGKLLGKP